ncbi:protein-methionine-sulfoxide reductase heme-binding subunit MsrQ [Rhodalgimonas zhirmunskyi]|uniref:Protein-methionine-sulfoxide reductase heme-binding subunit MsrQ n=1 Tax=Rhodalgimonas zhirmunskyi TaxID=2964767 RepID=A0AAJ1U6G0_9RHOB|nr:protein-methionine-sulfoxide reductase heme-binding subunit MsrQ [Rhodoalgimonas zhirmunskyi]MDQ2093899.1 protein-methionine-sulfoxide reductase heme-binding subunit MsrQ [Rhodoalgimonas zhirmunskyi]
MSSRGAFAGKINRALRRVPAAPIYILCAAHIGWLFWQGVNGALGPEPIKALEHAYGETALKLLVGVLAITPLLKLTRINLIRYRRALGLSAFFYVVAHLAVWLFLDVQVMAQIWADIVKRPYITVGMAGFALLVPLAVTSNDWMIRRMGGQGWRLLHRLTYPAAILAAVHFVMLRKGWQIEPLVDLGLIVLLLVLRLRRGRRRAPARVAG